MSSLLQDKLYEVHMQAPPPSKDFHHLTVTKNEVKSDILLYWDQDGGKLYPVSWKSWRISFRPDQERNYPREVKKFHKDFVMDEQLHKQLQSIFGKKMLDYILHLCQGHYDFLIRMPENLILHILSFLNAEDIEQFSKTCKKFHQLCNTEEFWERIKRLQDKYTLVAKTIKFPAHKKTENYNQRRGNLTQIQRRQTTFF